MEEYRRDPLNYHGPIRVRTGAEILGAIADVRASLPRMRTPLLVLHGDADGLCRVEGSRALAADLHLAGSAPCRLIEYAGLKHEILFEPGQDGGERVLEDALEWIKARVVGGLDE